VTFPLNFAGQVRAVTKIAAEDFTPLHREALAGCRYAAGNLILSDPDWASTFLGAGEEKAVFCVCDPQNRVFAVEAINEKTCLNGRFAGGQYFAEMSVAGLRNVRANPESLLGLTFTGKIKAREFVYGFLSNLP
jgi:hypothetical protein